MKRLQQVCALHIKRFPAPAHACDVESGCTVSDQPGVELRNPDDQVFLPVCFVDIGTQDDDSAVQRFRLGGIQSDGFSGSRVVNKVLHRAKVGRFCGGLKQISGQFLRRHVVPNGAHQPDARRKKDQAQNGRHGDGFDVVGPASGVDKHVGGVNEADDT